MGFVVVFSTSGVLFYSVACFCLCLFVFCILLLAFFQGMWLGSAVVACERLVVVSAWVSLWLVLFTFVPQIVGFCRRLDWMAGLLGQVGGCGALCC